MVSASMTFSSKLDSSAAAPCSSCWHQMKVKAKRKKKIGMLLAAARPPPLKRRFKYDHIDRRINCPTTTWKITAVK